MSLTNLQITGTYSAKYVREIPTELPPECKLPEDISIPPLPPLLAELPDPAPKQSFDPLIPPPHNCYPDFKSSVTTSVDVHPSSASLSIVPFAECGTELVGNIDICQPTFEGTIGVHTAVGEVSSGNISLEPKGPCGSILNGNINICQPNFGGTVLVRVAEKGEQTGGIISLSPDDSCGAVLSGSVVVGSGGGGLIDEVLSTRMQSLKACELSEEDMPHLELGAASSDGPTQLGLAGKLPIPCFQCEKTSTTGPGADWTFDEMELGKLSAKEVTFDNPCCGGSQNGWKNCGTRLEIYGDAATGGAMISLDANDLNASVERVRLREFTFCVNGESRKCLILASNFYD